MEASTQQNHDTCNRSGESTTPLTVGFPSHRAMLGLVCAAHGASILVLGAWAWSSQPHLDPKPQSIPWGMLLGGSLLLLVLSGGLTWRLLRQILQQEKCARETCLGYRHSMEREFEVTRHELDKQKQLLEDIIANIPHHVFWKDRNSVYQGCNDQFARTAGLQNRQDIFGKTDFDLPWTQEEAEGYRRTDTQVMQSGRAELNLEESQRNNEGLQTYVLTSKVPLQDLDGTVYGVLGIYADITERKRMEQLLQTRMAAIDAAAEMVFIADRQGRITYVNPSFSATTGYASEEIIGQTPRILSSGQHSHGFYASMWETILAGKVWAGEIINRRKDGSMYPQEMTITPIRDKDGQVTQFVAIQRDVTAKKDRESLARERSSLKEAVASMEQVLGVVGHELRTPLAGVRALTELMLAELMLTEREGAREQRGMLSSVHEEVLRMSDILNHMLEAARISSGRARWNWSSFGVNVVCWEAAASMESMLDISRVSLQVVVEPVSLKMNGDEEALRRLVLNLLSNSAKHTTDGSITVHASSYKEADRDWVQIQVSDTGTGIRPELLSHLGEAFALNVGVAGGINIMGTGLGLSICKGIVAAHGGYLSVQSVWGTGTTIIARLRADLDAPMQGKLLDDHLNIAPAPDVVQETSH